LWRKGVAIAVQMGFLPFATACFGGFKLPRKVYQFNHSVSTDQWIRWRPRRSRPSRTAGRWW
jgi:hypothetical protein